MKNMLNKSNLERKRKEKQSLVRLKPHIYYYIKAILIVVVIILTIPLYNKIMQSILYLINREVAVVVL